MTYLTASDATPESAYRFFAELASLNLDYDGVPDHSRMIDVVVAETTQAATSANALF